MSDIVTATHAIFNAGYTCNYWSEKDHYNLSVKTDRIVIYKITHTRKEKKVGSVFVSNPYYPFKVHLHSLKSDIVKRRLKKHFKKFKVDYTDYKFKKENKKSEVGNRKT